VSFLEKSCVMKKCKKQIVVSWSIAESEYGAMINVTLELICIRGLLTQIDFSQSVPLDYMVTIRQRYTLLKTQCSIREPNIIRLIVI